MQFSAAATTGGPRSGTLTIAGQTVHGEPGSGCSVSIAPTSASVAAGGRHRQRCGDDRGRLRLDRGQQRAVDHDRARARAAAATARSQYSAAATTGGPRTGTLTIAGQTFTVTQAAAAAFAIAPDERDVPAGGGTGSVAVTSAAGCAWTATSNASWLTDHRRRERQRQRHGRCTASRPTPAAPRSGTLTIAGQTFTVNQAAAAFALRVHPGSTIAGRGRVGERHRHSRRRLRVDGGEHRVVADDRQRRERQRQRHRRASTAAANTGVARSGTVTIAGQTYTVNQAERLQLRRGADDHRDQCARGKQQRRGHRPGRVHVDGIERRQLGDGGVGLPAAVGTARRRCGRYQSGGSRSGTATVAGQTVTINQAATLCSGRSVRHRATQRRTAKKAQ